MTRLTNAQFDLVAEFAKQIDQGESFDLGNGDVLSIMECQNDGGWFEESDIELACDIAYYLFDAELQSALDLKTVDAILESHGRQRAAFHSSAANIGLFINIESLVTKISIVACVRKNLDALLESAKEAA